MAILTFNIAYDSGIFIQKRYRIQISGLYLLLAYTGCCVGELYHELFPFKGGPDAVLPSLEGQNMDDDDDDSPLSKQDQILDEIPWQETVGRGRLRALCYEDVQLMAVRHSKTSRDTLAMKPP